MHALKDTVEVKAVLCFQVKLKVFSAFLMLTQGNTHHPSCSRRAAELHAPLSLEEAWMPSWWPQGHCCVAQVLTWLSGKGC